MRHVFISYHHDDGDFAENLISRIEKVDLETWVDNDHLQAGEDWRTEIDQAIKDACALIVIMTPEARSSEYVTYEWAFAWGAGVKVIPVLYKDTKLHPRLEALQYLDFTSRTTRPWDALFDAIRIAARLHPQTSPSSSSSLPSYLRQALEDLDNANANDRKNAIENLAKLNSPIARQALKDAINHPLQDVRFSAALIQAEFKDLEAIPILLEAIHQQYQGSRYYDYHDAFLTSKAYQALCEMGIIVIPLLTESLHDKDVILRIIAAEALGKIGDPIAVPGLLETLHDEIDLVRGSAAEALGKIGDPTAVPVLLEALNDDTSSVRESAAKALGQIRDVSAVPNLVKALHDNYPGVRLKACQALGEIGDPIAVPGLLKALHGDGGIRSSAADALGQIRDVSAVPGLLEALFDKSVDVRRSAIEALGEIGDPTAVPGLLEFLNDEKIWTMQDTKKRDDIIFQQNRLSIEVINAIAKMGKIATPYLLEALHRKNWNVRDKSIKILGKIKDAAAVPGLISILREENMLRESAIEALMEIGDASAVPGLLETINDKNINVRRSAIKVLIKIGDPTAVPGLLEALKNDEDKIVRERTIEALGRIGDPTAVPGLLEALKKDGDQDILREASKALVKIGRLAVPDLLDTLYDENISIRRRGMVANALRQIGTPEALAAIKTGYQSEPDNM